MFKKIFALALLFAITGCAAPSAASVSNAPHEASIGSRTANIKEIQNNVQARNSTALEFSEANIGSIIGVGGQARTGPASKTRLDFVEGTIVRLGESTVLTVEELASTDGNPFTRFQMELGKLWITLRGGSMDIKTPAGIVSVRGSHYIIEVFKNPETGQIVYRAVVITGSASNNGKTANPKQILILHPNSQPEISEASVEFLFDFCNNVGPTECDGNVANIWGFGTVEKIKEQIEKGGGKSPCRSIRGC